MNVKGVGQERVKIALQMVGDGRSVLEELEVQEAFLARELLFEVQNGALLHSNDLLPAFRFITMGPLHKQFQDILPILRREAPSDAESMRLLEYYEPEPEKVAHLAPLREAFVFSPLGFILDRDMYYALNKKREPMHGISRTLPGRRTSKPEDEPIAVASLCNVDVAPLLEYPDLESRMSTFYLLLKRIPTAILFGRRTENMERLTEVGFRWAPRHLTDISFLLKSEGGFGICSPDGFTTEEVFELLCFETVEVDHTDRDGRILVRELAITGLIYGIKPHPRHWDSSHNSPSFLTENPQEYPPRQRFNAILAAPGTIPKTLEGDKYTTFANVICVNILACEDGRDVLGKMTSLADQPTVCEFLFTAHVMGRDLLGSEERDLFLSSQNSRHSRKAEHSDSMTPALGEARKQGDTRSWRDITRREGRFFTSRVTLV